MPGGEQSMPDKGLRASFQPPVADGPLGHPRPLRPQVFDEPGGRTRCSPRPQEPGTSTARRQSPGHTLITFEKSSGFLCCLPVHVPHSRSEHRPSRHRGAQGAVSRGTERLCLLIATAWPEAQGRQGPGRQHVRLRVARREVSTGSRVAKALSGDCATVYSRFEKEKPIQLPPETAGSGF